MLHLDLYNNPTQRLEPYAGPTLRLDPHNLPTLRLERARHVWIPMTPPRTSVYEVSFFGCSKIQLSKFTFILLLEFIRIKLNVKLFIKFLVDRLVTKTNFLHQNTDA